MLNCLSNHVSHKIYALLSSFHQTQLKNVYVDVYC